MTPAIDPGGHMRPFTHKISTRLFYCSNGFMSHSFLSGSVNLELSTGPGSKLRFEYGFNSLKHLLHTFCDPNC
jgi:hypothetical protein